MSLLAALAAGGLLFLSKGVTMKTVCITGGAGMIGSHLAEVLVERGHRVTVIDDLERGNLFNLHAIRDKIKFKKRDLSYGTLSLDYDIVFHLCAKVTGIHYNRLHQLDMMNSNLAINHTVFEAARLSKPRLFVNVSTACVTGDTRIYSMGEYQKISACGGIYSTLTEQGYRRVTRYIPVGVKDTVYLKTNCGYSISGAKDHRIMLWTTHGLEWEYLDHIKSGDIAIIVSGENDTPPMEHFAVVHWERKDRQPHASFVKEIYSPTTVCSWMGEIIGYWIGDGSYNTNKQVLFCDSRIEVLNHINSHLASVFGITGKIVRNGRQFQLVVCSTLLVDYFKSALGLETGLEKYVPEYIWSSPTNVQCAFLQGLFEADGTVGIANKQISFTTVSKTLAHDVQQLLLRLGIFSNVIERDLIYPNGKVAELFGFSQNKQSSTRYDVIINGGCISKFSALIGFISEFKKQRLSELYDSRGNIIPFLNERIKNWYNLLGKPKKFRKILGPALYQDYSISNRKLNELLSEFECEDATILFAARSDVFMDKVDFAVMQSPQMLYDLTVPETSSYISNGFVSHNCVYPHDAPIPTPESCADVCNPEPTNWGYGVAKWVGEQQANFLHQEYGMAVVNVRFYNSLGPRDYYDKATSHVAPAIIRRVIDGENPLKVWGSGNQSRVLVDCRDIAEVLFRLANCPRAYDARPINIGHPHEVTIKELVSTILALMGREREVMWDTTMPEGYPRRCPDMTRLISLIGNYEFRPLEMTLSDMLIDYRMQLAANLVKDIVPVRKIRKANQA